MGVRGSRKRLRMKEQGLSRARRRRLEGLGMLDVPRPFLLGRRSRKDGVAWTCKCLTVNYPSHHLFVNLPAFVCSNPDCKFDPVRVNFRFSFGNLDANGVCPVGTIHHQGEEGDCLIFAIAKCAEITVRIVRSLLGIQHELGSFDPYSLKDNFVDSQVAEGMEKDDICLFDGDAKLKMLEVLETVGIQEVRDQEKEGVYRMKSETIDGDFETVAMALADGWPLLIDFANGLNFGNLEYHVVYKAPYNNEKPLPDLLPSHAVVLVGAARCGLMDYYYFVNSHGIQFCVRVRNGYQLGGIGKLRAKDILERPHKFLRISVEPKEESVDIVKNFRVWRIFASGFASQSTPEMMFGLYLLYYFRVFERQIGSNKYSVFSLFTITVSLLLEILCLFLLKDTNYINALASGPYGLIFDWFIPFFLDIPVTSRFFVFGVNFSDKLFIDLAGMQLLLSSSKQSFVPGICGIITGLLYRLNVLGIPRTKLPQITAAFFTRLASPSGSSSRPSRSLVRNMPLHTGRAVQNQPSSGFAPLVEPPEFSMLCWFRWALTATLLNMRSS